MIPRNPRPPRNPRTHLTREQVRAVDRLAIHELGIPGIVLMENAGRNATEAIQRYMKQRGATLESALIFCGGGNNGGDGYVIARHLHNHGIQVHILTTKPIDQLTGDAAINAIICRKMNLDIQPANHSQALLQDAGSSSPPDLIIDALLGTGFTGDLRPDMLNLIQAINATRDTTVAHHPDDTPGVPPQRPAIAPVIAAIDLPSGLDCDTGRPPDNPAQAAVHADLTITFVAPKLGFTKPEAKPYLGELEVADIGVPPELIAQITNP